VGRLKLVFTAAALALVAAAVPAFGATWIWDQNQNRIDDRIEAVNLNGLAAAHVGNDLNGRLILFVYPEATPLEYGVYVGYDHPPTDADVAALTATGARLLWRPRYIDYLRARASFAQVQALAALAHVRRVEGWQAMYPFNDNATRTLRARDSQGGVGAGMFPSVWRQLGLTGRGIVVGIIDTGVNDQASGAYPGHVSLRGKFVGGGDFSNPDATLNTPPESSMNPQNTADPLGDYHATHVAGTAIGTGGPEGILDAGSEPGRYAGMAPDARLVDCKALSDAGVGGGASEALEWCIAHRFTDWGTDATGADYRGVQVVNMSLGGTSASDGTDADAVEVNAATRAGIAVCVASGNDSKTAYMPSPAAADLAITVGALQDANSLPHVDDIVASYSNEGPRMSDGDTDHFDEMKPAVLGSGSDIVSALGDPTTDGTHYHNINGTSMATPTIAGLCALILQANPRLTPIELRAVLENTAEHRTDHGKQPPSAADPFHLDPNYHPSWGWGEPDAYAAAKEALDPATTQVIAEGATASVVGGQLEDAVRWTTQREIGVASFRVYRANDVNGFAGDFVAASPPVFPVGQAQIERTTNRTHYAWTDVDPGLTPGEAFWYQVRWIDGQAREHTEPAFRITTDVPPVRARVRWVISHEALDNDIFARFGSGTNPDVAAFQRPCGGTSSADSVRVVTPAGFGGGIRRYYFHADLTDADLVGDFLPPAAANPWFLAVLEKGFVNTEGLVDSFSVTVYDGATATTLRAPNPSTATAEGQTTTFWIPADPVTTPNHTPVLDPIGGRTAYEGIPLTIQARATDPDGQAVTYSAASLPPGAHIGASSGTFTWTPSYGRAGNYTVAIRATDPQLARDEEQVPITVVARAPGSNSPPALDPLEDHTTHAGTTMSFGLSAHDAENNPLGFTAYGAPPRATLDAVSGAFAWSPGLGEVGTYAVRFRVTDTAGAYDEQTVLLTSTTGTPMAPSTCSPDSATFAGTAGTDVQGLNDVYTLQPFTVAAGVAEIRGALAWTGAPAVDLDLYLLDAAGNTVASGATATADPEVATYVAPEPGTYSWKVVSFDNADPNQPYTVTSVQCTAAPVAVGPREGDLTFALEQNAPNPFSRSALIRFATPAAGPVQLAIYDVSGRRVRTLMSGWMEAGPHQRVWDGTTDRSERVHPGVYFYRLTAAAGTRTRTMILMR